MKIFERRFSRLCSTPILSSRLLCLEWAGSIEVKLEELDGGEGGRATDRMELLDEEVRLLSLSERFI